MWRRQFIYVIIIFTCIDQPSHYVDRNLNVRSDDPNLSTKKLSSVVSLLEAILYKEHPYRQYQLWNIVSDTPYTGVTGMMLHIKFKTNHIWTIDINSHVGVSCSTLIVNLKYSSNHNRPSSSTSDTVQATEEIQQNNANKQRRANIHVSPCRKSAPHEQVNKSMRRLQSESFCRYHFH